MPDVNDITLLREYADCNSESAFAEIVHRHINLVYSVALRYVGNSPDAQDVTQAVFIILAQKAASLRQKTALTGWLYETTRFTAMNFLTNKTRRQAREQKAYMESTLNDSNSENVWRQLAPLLEEAMTRLSEKERALVALRFFENKSAMETAALLGIQEWAAHKRAARAMEKLRKFFIKRGIASTTATLAWAISANSVQAAPTALAKTVTAVAIAKGATASGSTLTLIKGALKVMAWSKAKTAIVAGVGVLLAAATTTVTVREIVAHRPQIWQEKYDLLVLEKIPQQVKILRAIPWRQGGTWGDNSQGTMGLGVSVKDIVQEAYGGTLGRMIYPASLPGGKYDFISNLHQGAGKALQQEIKNKFGLIGRRELIETNVMVLTIRNRNAAGLKPSSAAANESFSNRDTSSGSYSCHNQPISNLVGFLEDYLGMPVLNQTGLTGRFDIDLTVDGTPEGLKRTVLEQLGLELVTSRQAIEFVVVEKAR